MQLFLSRPVHTTPEEFENVRLTLKTQQMFSVQKCLANALCSYFIQIPPNGTEFSEIKAVMGGQFLWVDVDGGPYRTDNATFSNC